jgi:hypothetical protein
MLYGSVGGYVMLYDLRYNTLSSVYKHSMRYPINSLSIFKPDTHSHPVFNRSKSTSPMVVVAAGGPSYELSLLNLETGDTEYLMIAEDESGFRDKKEDPRVVGYSYPSFLRESMIRDSFNWPEKLETSMSLFDRYMAQSRSLINSHQLKLIQNIDDELFRTSENRYALLK